MCRAMLRNGFASGIIRSNWSDAETISMALRKDDTHRSSRNVAQRLVSSVSCRALRQEVMRRVSSVAGMTSVPRDAPASSGLDQICAYACVCVLV